MCSVITWQKRPACRCRELKQTQSHRELRKKSLQPVKNMGNYSWWKGFSPVGLACVCFHHNCRFAFSADNKSTTMFQHVVLATEDKLHHNFCWVCFGTIFWNIIMNLKINQIISRGIFFINLTSISDQRFALNYSIKPTVLAIWARRVCKPLKWFALKKVNGAAYSCRCRQVNPFFLKTSEPIFVFLRGQSGVDPEAGDPRHPPRLSINVTEKRELRA